MPFYVALCKGSSATQRRSAFFTGVTFHSFSVWALVGCCVSSNQCMLGWDGQNANTDVSPCILIIQRWGKFHTHHPEMSRMTPNWRCQICSDFVSPSNFKSKMLKLFEAHQERYLETNWCYIGFLTRVLWILWFFILTAVWCGWFETQLWLWIVGSDSRRKWETWPILVGKRPQAKIF